jgi:internalin A
MKKRLHFVLFVFMLILISISTVFAEKTVEKIEFHTKLGITDKQLVDMIENGTIPLNVTHLNLSSTTQVTDLSPLKSLPGLRNLGLANTQVTDFSPLSELNQLESLNLANNHITDITFLSELTNLRELRLSNNQITDISPLNGLTNLESLNLSNNQITDITPLTNLTNLGGPFGVLNLGDNQINDVSPLSGLTKLQWLSLENNQISDPSLLATLKDLTFYLLHGNPVTDEQLADLRANLRKANFFMGYVLGGEEVGVDDALEILKWLVGLESVLNAPNQ